MIGTAGIDFKKKIIVINDKTVKITVFDTAGQERFRNISRNLYKNADGIILVYDVTDTKSKESVFDWLNLIKKNLENLDIDIILIGNKIDLADERKVTKDDGEIISKQLNYQIIETSAKTGKNVNEAFMIIIKKIFNKNSLKLLPKTLETEVPTNRDKALSEIAGEPIKKIINDNNVFQNKKKSKNCCCK